MHGNALAAIHERRAILGLDHELWHELPSAVGALDDVVRLVLGEQGE